MEELSVASWQLAEPDHEFRISSVEKRYSMSGRVGLFDVKSGKRLAEVSGEEESGTPPPDAPQWGKELRGQQEPAHGLQVAPPLRGAVS